MTEKPRYYITTAIAYPNGAPHIGHAYEAIATDAIARFMRLDGYDVYFLTGTDEHGIKMLQTATREGITPRELVERNVPRFQAMVEAAQLLERRLHPHHRGAPPSRLAGDLGAHGRRTATSTCRQYAGWYSVRDEAYYDEDETDGRRARASALGPQGTPVEWVEEESYFFRLSAYQDKLLELYARIRTSCCRRSGSTRS